MVDFTIVDVLLPTPATPPATSRLPAPLLFLFFFVVVEIKNDVKITSIFFFCPNPRRGCRKIRWMFEGVKTGIIFPSLIFRRCSKLLLISFFFLFRNGGVVVERAGKWKGWDHLKWTNVKKKKRGLSFPLF